MKMDLSRFLWKIVAQLLIISGIVGFIAISHWSAQIQRHMTIPEEYFKMFPVLLASAYAIVVLVIGFIALIGGGFFKRHPKMSAMIFIFSFVTGFLAILLCYLDGNNSPYETAISAIGISLTICTCLTILFKSPISKKKTSILRIAFVGVIMLILAILVIGLVLPQWFDAVAQSFKDPYLKSIVRDEVGKTLGFVSQSDLERTTHIDAWMGHVSDLTGIEKCTGLKFLQLGYQLGDNNDLYLKDITPLSNLKELTVIELTGNQIVDISPLASLTNLEHLYLGSNEIIDISPLSQLNNLSILELWANEIRDISPISEMTSLIGLNLGQNPLSEDSLDIYIPQLESRGVDVRW